MFARRAAWDLRPTEFARRVAERRASALPLIDLAESNPTRCGLAPAAALRAALARSATAPDAAIYEPDPRGPTAARAAIAAYHARDGASVAPEHVVLTAGTSEGYAHLFRLLADPGDVVHLPVPGYPLFEHLAALEGVAGAPCPLLRRGAHWRIDLDAFAAALTPRSRAVVAIDPHNPAGAFVGAEDWASLRSIARERGLALIADEVFADFASDAAARPPGALSGAGGGPLHFVLSGASKVLALPQLKLAWIVVAGPAAARDEALARLEFIADAHLSVSPLLAAVVPELLAQRDAIQRPIRERVARNRAALVACGLDVLPAEAGWQAIVRIAGRDEDSLTTALLDAGVLVQPGSLFDLEERGATHFVVSLLPEPSTFDAALPAMARVAGA
jgi:aspartate/methionine/tyrosine aminotransferase